MHLVIKILSFLAYAENNCQNSNTVKRKFAWAGQ